MATTEEHAVCEWKKDLACILDVLKGRESGEQNHPIPQLDSLVAQLLNIKDFKFYEFVEALGPQLSNTNDDERLRGIQVLSAVLEKLPTHFLREAEVDTLVVFFINKLDEKYLILPHVFKGILALSKCRHMREAVASKMARAIVQNTHVQSHLQADRYAIYCAIANLLDNHLQELCGIGADFVLGFIQMMDGEKDPRCLLLVLRLVPIITKNFDLGPFVEELFEVTSCYFPIDFTPPPNDPRGITREQLSVALDGCLASTPKFAPFCIPLLIEKMESELIDAKMSAFRAMSTCCQTYGSSDLKPFLATLWSAIRKEAFTPKMDKTEKGALTTLTSIVQCLSRSAVPADQVSPLEDFLDTILKECEPSMCRCDVDLLQPCAKLLQSAALGSNPACSRILSTVLPLLMQQFAVDADVHHRKCVIDVVSGFLVVAKEFPGGENDGDLSWCPLSKHRESLLTLLLSVLSDPNGHLRSSALNSLRAVLDIDGLAKEKHIRLLGEHVRHLVEGESNPDVRSALMELLVKMASLHPDIVFETIVEPLLDGGALLGRVNSNNARLLAIGSCASCHVTILAQVMPVLVKNIIDGATEPVCKCILQAVDGHLHLDSSLALLHSTCLAPIVHFLMITTELIDHSILDAVCGIVQTISQAMPATPDMQDLVNQVTTTLTSTESLKVDNDHSMVILALFRSLVCNASLEIVIPRFLSVVECLLDVAVSWSSGEALTASQCIASLVNKQKDESELAMAVDSVSQKVVTIVESDSGQSVRAVVCWTWMTKGLVLRGHHLMTHSIQQMLKWLAHEVLGGQVAEGFGTVHEDVPGVLTKEGHAVIRFTFHQRFFLETARHLLEGYEKANEDVRPNYLTALCRQLRFVPRPVLKAELTSILPILIQALRLDQESILQSTLSAFEDLLSEGANLFESQLHSLIPRFVELSRYQGCMSIRRSSLHCLTLLATSTLPDHLLLPHRQGVIQQLTQCIDDKKRLVRKEAVVARCNWFLIGQPGR